MPHHIATIISVHVVTVFSSKAERETGANECHESIPLCYRNKSLVAKLLCACFCKYSPHWNMFRM